MIRQSAQRIHILKLTFALTLVVVSTLNQSAAAKAPDEPAPQPADSYSESIRTSQYVTVRDGTRLAIDIYRPAVGGKPIVTKLPVILVATPYHRSSDNNGEILTFLAPYGNHRSIYDALLRHGYVIASLDIRGRGASFGKVYAGGMDADVNRLDLYDVIEWLAVQPWSDGNVGMCGCSYVARTQFWAASGTPPHLKAIAPSGSPFDTYALLRVNGVRQIPDFEKWDQNLQALDTKVLAAPVDEDKS
jgi:putative CocE/NonD family hydrolase